MTAACLAAATASPGPRQTVDRACHPDLGDGVVVYRNGPAWFRADADGTIELYTRVEWGGCSVTHGSWLWAHGEVGKRRLDTTKRQRGDRHDRAVTMDGAPGWLVRLAHPLEEPRTGFARHRWEPDGGAPELLYVVRFEVGPPGALKRSARRKSGLLTAEEERWRTYTTTEGKAFVCRDEDET